MNWLVKSRVRPRVRAGEGDIVVFFDAHCHWGAADGVSSFRGADDIRLVCAGTGPSDWDAVRRAPASIPGLSVSYGVHPWQVRTGADTDLWLAELKQRLVADATAAVGEIGLDFAVRDCPSTLQRAVFLAQLRLAATLRRVAVIHCVQAWGPLVEALDEAGPLPRGFVLHAYGGSAEMVAPLARRGAYFSFKCNSGGRGQGKTEARVRAVPPDRLLLESDRDLCDGADETAYRERLAGTAAFLAAATGTETEQVAEQAFRNASRCFLADDGPWTSPGPGSRISVFEKRRG
jgi:TatD DNase family protein